MRKHHGVAGTIAMLLLGAAVLTGCGAMQGIGVGKPAQVRCACGLALGHAGAHAYHISDFLKAKQQQERSLEIEAKKE